MICQCNGCYLYHSSCSVYISIYAEFMESKEKVKAVKEKQ